MSFFDRFRDSLGPDFTVLRSIGAGGMGEVFEAVDNRLERKVAIKVLKPEQATAVATQRFLREARLMARLKHPCVVKVHSVGEDKGLSWFVMDLVEGETLATRLARGPLTGKETIQLARDLLSALTEAHEKGIVHRDIKPANIFIEKGRALISDFGIARTATTSGADAGLTATQQPIGTPAYMSPEQASAGDVGPASDQYSLALVLYECLSGQRWPQMQSLDSGDWSKVPSSLAFALKKAMSFEPAERWSDADSFAAALGPRVNWRRWIPGAGLLGAGIVAWIFVHPTCGQARDEFAPGLEATVPCRRYDAWLNAERVFAGGDWEGAGKAYRTLLEENQGCLACQYRLIEIDRWLENTPDSTRARSLLEGISNFHQQWRGLVAASLEPPGQRVEQLAALTTNYSNWHLGWAAYGSELFNRGSLFGRRRSEAIEALNSQRALDAGFVPAWTDRTLALIANGDSAAADTAIRRLRSLPATVGLAQAQRLLAAIAFAFRFTSHGLQTWDSASHDPSVRAGLPKVAAGPRVLAGLGSPLGEVELGRAFETSGQLPLQRSGLIAEMLGSIALGRIDSARAAGRRLNAMFPSNELLAFDAMLQATVLLLDEETTAFQAAEVGKRMGNFTRAQMPPAVRRDAAWLGALAAIRSRDPPAAHRALALLVDDPAPAFRRTFVEGALLAMSGAVDSALTITDMLATKLEGWDRAERSPLLRAASRMSRAQWYAATGFPENARSEYRWHEHFHLPDYPIGNPLPADGDWAFSTLAYWRQARLLDRGESGDVTDREVCSAYRRVAERWATGDTRYRARADTARTRLAALTCDKPA
jgi:hypothetical protein